MLMTIAFFWLVLGDLITLHQKAIYGFDPFSIETPFTKTDNSPVKSKTEKTSKFDKCKDQYHFDLVLNKEYHLKVDLKKSGFITTHYLSSILDQEGSPLLLLRGPPLS